MRVRRNHHPETEPGPRFRRDARDQRIPGEPLFISKWRGAGRSGQTAKKKAKDAPLHAVFPVIEEQK